MVIDRYLCVSCCSLFFSLFCSFSRLVFLFSCCGLHEANASTRVSVRVRVRSHTHSHTPTVSYHDVLKTLFCAQHKNHHDALLKSCRTGDGDGGDWDGRTLIVNGFVDVQTSSLVSFFVNCISCVQFARGFVARSKIHLNN